MRVTLNDWDRGKFKVPTLRNIEVSSPYMHNGSFQNLTEVIDFYVQGGNETETRSDLVRPIYGATQEEKDALVAFLKSLTDNEFLSKPDLSDPNL